MFAIFKTGGKQYKVTKGENVLVEKLSANVGENVCLKEVLLIENTSGVSLGDPFITGAEITATVVEQKRSKKVIVFKKRRRKNYRRKNTHRQHQTLLQINDIKLKKTKAKEESVAAN